MTTPHSTPPPISVIGIGCRLPGAAGADEFWQLMLDGRDATGMPPDGRAGHRGGGYLTDIDRFDNEWFGISGREAALMDPQQRIALEVAVEALDDAGIGYRAQGSAGAVIFGACGFEHGGVVLGRGGFDPPFAVTGSASSIIANRLSYVLDLRGPSMVVDSACSSSLVAVDLAVRLLADPAVPFAVVGGVNLTLLPHTTDYLAEAGFLSPEGRCAPFDTAADGYVRGEGCAVVVLQRSVDAVREGNRVYAEITGSAVGSDGRSNGLYAPNGRAQRDIIRAAWERAGARPAIMGYLECHGTGTALGDAIEVGALAEVRGEPEGTTWIGSMKSGVGHLEAAAGVSGLIKAALAVHHGTIPPTANFATPNPMLRLDERGLRVAQEPIDWSGVPAAERYAGVSSFGFGGTNAHLALRGAAPREPIREAASPFLLPLSGRDIAELRDAALRMAKSLEQARATSEAAGADDGREGTSLSDLAAGASRLIGEGARAAVLADDREDAVVRLRAVAAGADDPRVLGPATRRRPGGLLFLFSGQGGQHARMGRVLAGRYPVFASALTDAADAVATAGGPRVWTPRRGFTADGTDRGATDFVQPALFVYQIALAELLASLGVRPDAVAGHSLGEVAAAAVGGALTLGDAARVIVARSRALARLDGRGAMAVLEAEPDQAALMVEPMRASVGIAAINGPRSVVVSGDTRSVDTVVRRARRRGIFARRVAVEFAAHSPQVEAVLPEFGAAIRDLVARTPRIPLHSTAHPGRVITTDAMDAEYWIANARGTVELARALDSAAEAGMSTVVEIGPHPLLTPAVRDQPDVGASAHPATTREDEATGLLSCLAQLYLEGRSVDWSTQGRFEGAPRRRWRRRRFPLIAGAAPVRTDDLADHIVNGVTLVPAAYWLRRFTQLARESGRSTIAEVVVHEPLAADAPSGVVYRRESASVRAEAPGAGTLAKARLTDDPTPGDIIAWMRVVDANRAGRSSLRVIAPTAFYAALRERGLEYGPAFRPLRAIAGGRDRAIGTFTAADIELTATIDGCLQLLAALDHNALPADAVPLPITVGSAWLSPAPNCHIHEAHALLRTRTGTGLVGDVIATDQHGAPALALTGVQIRFTRPSRPVSKSQGNSETPSNERGPSADRTPAHSAHIGDVWNSGNRRRDPWQPAPPVLGDSVSAGEPVRRSGQPTDHRSADRRGYDPTARDDRDPVRRARIGQSRRALPYSANHPPEPGGGSSNAPTIWWREVWEPFSIVPAVDSVSSSGEPQIGGDDRTGAGRTAGGRAHSRSAVGRHIAPASSGPEIGVEPGSGRTGSGHVDSGPRESVHRTGSEIRRALVVGESVTAVQLTRELDRLLPSERVAREVDAAGPTVDAVLAGRTAAARTAVVVVWPASNGEATASEAGPIVERIGRVLDLVQRVVRSPAAGSLTVVLPDPATDVDRGGEPRVAGGVAGLLRSVQLESGRTVRLVWADEAADPALLARFIIDSAPGLPPELRLTGGVPAARRFVPADPQPLPATIDPHGTYVVSGGLGALGSVAVRWLLDGGARDVVVPTRAPRPVPPILDGLEDRIVVVRCDTADRTDLDHALRDIRECGSTIRGVVHAAGALEDALIEDVTIAQLDRMFAPKVAAATNLIELTAADPTDFVLLFSSATGAFGAPGQAAYACANAAMDTLSHCYPQRRITSIGWGVWDSGLSEAAGGAEHLRRAGIVPFDGRRGADLLHQAISHQAPHLVAMDYRPTADPSPIAVRLAELMGPRQVGREAKRDPRSSPREDNVTEPEPLIPLIRRILATTLRVSTEHVDTAADFNDLGLTSLLAVEMRRTLEHELGIRIATAELFRHPTVEVLAAALAERIEPVASDRIS
ncbi:SDR family NAD(P)-dependent oxidoreductase [Nocardia cyriacigeorgica]|uniref:SDR family NAD(P)-dependent oxidoreductase n=2 Tax=Nocardia cyriacigeorgica TaxID=135487 RepID=A0A6P1CZJ2_9NOCA|nr:type I polyketide synthase [Nocardia cyriacigeorgica]NEW38461.1 SDR family NAD(P)-dependent oxidoreductase [Nocardia cyriacigeorgica]NEW43575.1 SDR family NAD(P)-dependent oxidoreductase [Nocardia cyriacigeorgica]NEW49489.1 SDR family NAD(P)-dependent oxidoreductase [Nocardia cyriacigeorgica]NEW54107.1 SDR family NAD(P)-dependent oxidoreductase [Nocardia cyriacigeorgica]